MKACYFRRCCLLAGILLIMGINLAAADSLKLPGQLKRIEEEAFFGSRGFSSAVLPEGMEEIASRAFAHSSLQLIHLPSSIQRIAEDAFLGCEGLAARAEEGSYAYQFCQMHGIMILEEETSPDDFRIAITDEGAVITKYLGSAENVYVPQEIQGYPVVAVDYGAFQNNPSLKSVTFPRTLTRIGGHVFMNCTQLETVTLLSGEASFGESTFNDCVKLKSINMVEGATQIAEGAFRNCASLESINLGEGLTEIGSSAFLDCAALTDIALPEGITQIGGWAFNGCVNLTAADLPDTLESIGELAFYGSGLESVTIPRSTKQLGEHAFMLCASLKDVTIHGDLETIGQYAFYGCSALESLTVTGGVQGIGTHAFYNCINLVSAVLPSTVKVIEENAFRYCSGLAGITLPESLETIGTSAFYGCSGLTEIRIPQNVQSIEDQAFLGCATLSNATILSDDVSFGASVFANCPMLVIYAREGSTAHSYALANGLTFCALGAQPDQEGYEYEISANGYVTITGYTGDKTQLVIPNVIDGYPVRALADGLFKENERITSVVLPSGLWSIPDYAFEGCTSLKQVTMPDTLQSIGIDAFSNCTALELAEMPLSMTGGISSGAFRGCTKLKGIVLPQGVRSIGNEAFKDCSGITALVIPDTVTWIGYYAFTGCSSLETAEMSYSSLARGMFKDCGALETLKLNNRITSIEGYALSGCASLKQFDIPSDLMEIGEYAFAGCSSLSNIVLPSGLKQIPDGLLEGCAGLRQLLIPAGVRSIGYKAFAGCRGLSGIALPNGVEEIGNALFAGCTGLKTFEMPRGLHAVKSSMFEGCSALAGVTLHEGVKTIEDCAFAGCEGLTELTLPAGITGIGSQAFAGSGLKRISIPSGIEAIGSELFRDCTALKTVSLPAGITRIGSFAFANCRQLENLTLPEKLEVIGDQAFRGCSALKMLSIPDGAKEIGEYVFMGCDALVRLDVPASLDTFSIYSTFPTHEGFLIYTEYNAPVIRYAKSYDVPYFYLALSQEILPSGELASGKPFTHKGVVHSSFPLSGIEIKVSDLSNGSTVLHAYHTGDMSDMYDYAYLGMRKIKIEDLAIGEYSYSVTAWVDLENGTESRLLAYSEFSVGEGPLRFTLKQGYEAPDALVLSSAPYQAKGILQATQKMDSVYLFVKDANTGNMVAQAEHKPQSSVAPMAEMHANANFAALEAGTYDYELKALVKEKVYSIVKQRFRVVEHDGEMDAETTMKLLEFASDEENYSRFNGYTDWAEIVADIDGFDIIMMRLNSPGLFWDTVFPYLQGYGSGRDSYAIQFYKRMIVTHLKERLESGTDVRDDSKLFLQDMIKDIGKSYGYTVDAQLLGLEKGKEKFRKWIEGKYSDDFVDEVVRLEYGHYIGIINGLENGLQELERGIRIGEDVLEMISISFGDYEKMMIMLDEMLAGYSGTNMPPEFETALEQIRAEYSSASIYAMNHAFEEIGEMVGGGIKTLTKASLIAVGVSTFGMGITDFVWELAMDVLGYEEMTANNFDLITQANIAITTRRAYQHWFDMVNRGTDTSSQTLRNMQVMHNLAIDEFIRLYKLMLDCFTDDYLESAVEWGVQLNRLISIRRL